MVVPTPAVLKLFLRLFGDDWRTLSEMTIAKKLYKLADRVNCEMTRAEDNIGFYVAWLLPGIPPTLYSTYVADVYAAAELILARHAGSKELPPAKHRPRNRGQKKRSLSGGK